MSWFRKKVVVPAPTGDEVMLEGLETWCVRWTSRYGEFSGNTREEVQAFTNRQDALHFKRELEAAFKLLRHTSDTYVDIDKN